MTNISEFIVYLWLVPITLFVILPLTSLLVWSLARAVHSFWGLINLRGSESWEVDPVNY